MNKVHIVFGPQGAGKSTYSNNLSSEVSGVHLSIDNWMWNLYGPDLPQPMNLKWIMERVGRCERLIWSTALSIMGCGSAVILDLGFTKRAKRDLFIAQAKELQLPTQLHFIDAPLPIRRRRVLDRNIDKGETYSFEVTAGMFDFMEGEYESPTEKELKNSIIVNTNT